MIDIKQYLEETNTVLLTKEAFECLKKRARVFDKIKAEYEASDDLISREETLTAFADYVGSGISMDDYDALWDIVVKMPPVKEPKWIPISERLPEENGYYLTTTMYHEVYCDYWEEGRFNRTETVIAWMPLPEPYEPQESCDTCKHKDDGWNSEPCDGCCGNHSGFEPQEREVES